MFHEEGLFIRYVLTGMDLNETLSWPPQGKTCGFTTPKPRIKSCFRHSYIQVFT
jgi:hypothetical protein